MCRADTSDIGVAGLLGADRAHARDPSGLGSAADVSAICGYASAANHPFAERLTGLRIAHDDAGRIGRISHFPLTYTRVAGKSRRAEIVLIPLLDVLQALLWWRQRSRLKRALYLVEPCRDGR